MAVSFSGIKMQNVNRLIDELFQLFLEDTIKEFKIELDGLLIDENEFYKLVGNYDGSNGVINNDVHIDEYTYYINDMDMKKLIIEYIKKGDGRYEILSIEGFNDKKPGDDNE